LEVETIPLLRILMTQVEFRSAAPRDQRLVRFDGEARGQIDPEDQELPRLAGLLQTGDVVARLLLRSRDGTDSMELFHGTISSIERSAPAARIHLRRTLPGERLPLSIGGAPVVFGEGELTLQPLFPVTNARLRGPLTADATALPLDRAVPWPTIGRVQLQDELLLYRGISADRRTLEGIVRAEPRSHRGGVIVIALPLEPLRWVVAGHAAEVLELRTGDEGGESVTPDLLLESSGAAGPVQLIHRAERLPLRLTRAAGDVLRITPLERSRWTIEPATTALDPVFAITRESPARGSVFTTIRRNFEAIYRERPEELADRFDEVLTAALRLEYSDTPGWDNATRLLVRVEKGTAALEWSLKREGPATVLPVESTAPLTLSWQRFPLVATSLGPSWERGEVDGWRHDGSSPSRLEFALPTPPPPSPSGWVGLRFGVRIRVATPPAGLVLRIETPDATLALPVSLPDPEAQVVILPVESFAEGSRYLVDAVGGSPVELLAAWVDLASVPPTSGVDARLVVGTGYLRARFDVSSLLPDSDRGRFFTDQLGALRVRVTLLNPPTLPGWAVHLRDLRWERLVTPVSAITPTTDLWARVRGLSGNPARVLRELLRFAAAPVNEASANAAAVICDRRAELLARVIREEELTIGQAIREVLGEGALTLQRLGNQWTIHATPRDPARLRFDSIETGSVLTGSGEERFAPPESARSSPRWMGAIVGGSLTEVAGPLDRRDGVEVSLDPRQMSLQPGSIVRVPVEGRVVQGEVEESLFADDHFRIRLARSMELETLSESPFGAVLREAKGERILFAWGNEVVAELHAEGDLLLRGTVREVASGLFPAGSFYLFQGAAQRLLLSSPDGGAIAITTDGTLLTSVPIRECVPLSGSTSGDLAPRPGEPALRITSTALLLRGRLLLHQPIVP
jgi:hypothetical protein